MNLRAGWGAFHAASAGGHELGLADFEAEFQDGEVEGFSLAGEVEGDGLGESDRESSWDGSQPRPRNPARRAGPIMSAVVTLDVAGFAQARRFRASRCAAKRAEASRTNAPGSGTVAMKAPLVPSVKYARKESWFTELNDSGQS